jgi:glucokinase
VSGRGLDAVAAVDIGATKTSVAVVPLPIRGWPERTADGTVRVRTTPTDRDPDVVLATIVAAVRAGLADFGPAGTVVLRAVGCAAPGPLDPDRGIVVHSPNLGWRDVPIGPLLGAALGVPWRLDDDANLGAFGEAILGAGRGSRTVAYLTVSSGIGGGIVRDGLRLVGDHALAGEVGHLDAGIGGEDVPRCSCGRRGHVEAYAGGVCLGARAARRWPRGRLSNGQVAPLGADAILRAARREPEVRPLVRDAETALAVAIGALAAVLDPGDIVVGGATAIAHPGLVRRATAIAMRRAIPEASLALRVRPAALGAGCVLAGASLIAAAIVDGDGGHDERPGMPLAPRVSEIG